MREAKEEEEGKGEEVHEQSNTESTKRKIERKRERKKKNKLPQLRKIALEFTNRKMNKDGPHAQHRELGLKWTCTCNRGWEDVGRLGSEGE